MTVDYLHVFWSEPCSPRPMLPLIRGIFQLWWLFFRRYGPVKVWHFKLVSKTSWKVFKLGIWIFLSWLEMISRLTLFSEMISIDTPFPCRVKDMVGGIVIDKFHEFIWIISGWHVNKKRINDNIHTIMVMALTLCDNTVITYRRKEE